MPATGNRFLLQDILRDKWKFDGFVVSDWDSIKSLTTHGFADSARDAAVRAVNAGVDMEMTSHTYRDELASAVKQGLVQESTLDEAVRRVLTMKYRLGLLRTPMFRPHDRPRSLSELRNVRPRARLQSVVLCFSGTRTTCYRFRGRSNPLREPQPLIDSKPDILGSWSLASHPADAVTVLEGIRKRLGPDTKVAWAKGVEIVRGGPSIFDDQFPDPKPVLTTDAERKAEFERAIEMVKQSDVAIMVLGEAQTMSGNALRGRPLRCRESSRNCWRRLSLSASLWCWFC